MSEARSDGASIFSHVAIEGDLGRGLGQEWVAGNGAGAYASSTVALMHTRRYHGLLVAALDPPRGRHVVLSHVDITVCLPREPGVPRGAWELAKHQFPGIDPEKGPFYLSRFDQDPLPRWTYAVAGGELEVLLSLVRGENAAVLRYTWRGPQPVMLTLRPLLAMRHVHGLMREHGAAEQRVELRAGEMRVKPMRGLPRLCFRYEGTFVGSPDWWRRFEYLVERDRGLEFQEDLWTPGVFEIRLEPGGAPSYLVAGVDKLPDGRPDWLVAAAEEAILREDPGPTRPLLERRLHLAAELFRADLAPKPGIVAGYPWFEVWGRDTLIALPGLYLCTGKIEGALRVMREMLAVMKDGLIPNRLPDEGGEPDMHAADATLWFFEAARLIAETLGDDHAFVQRELLPALTSSFEAILRGTRQGVRVTEQGLVAAGQPGDALTWMDARVGGRAVTSRSGCPVELTALWAKGCETLARLARAAMQIVLADRAERACKRAREAFHARFWCEATGYPYDVIADGGEGDGETKDDASIRPNAIIALAVDPACFSPEQARATLSRARAELVTPAGLRTLSPLDPRYVGRYSGGVSERDRAYHQGTAWPWLIGPYVRATRQSVPPEDPLAKELPALVAQVASNELAVGQLPEIAWGNPPHVPSGCPAQAFSVAELLRVVVRDLA
ncbi:amylo-alpha-1,6-glucosidase [Polyangium aurulentum]|uniref:amylo-alpha-1,6-glucosidase n=1 Tax=Polyangium aurulentum TaxID=2567896 RepID=UPI0010AEB741|nr:amylo-alpha-1,6-glucosidase [Polyangium aurulentum]UQA58066.1 amylo-alpha-1,6-glucosidase [Polyangium aurulentum]